MVMGMAVLPWSVRGSVHRLWHEAIHPHMAAIPAWDYHASVNDTAQSLFHVANSQLKQHAMRAAYNHFMCHSGNGCRLKTCDAIKLVP
jgi:hypothetical protein